jgi:hypothetical protein
MPGQAYQAIQAHQVPLKPQGVTSPYPVTNRPPRARTAAVRHVPAHESERPAASLVKFRRCCPCALLSEAPLPHRCDSGLQQQVSDEPSWSPSQNPCTLLASLLFPPHPWSSSPAHWTVSLPSPTRPLTRGPIAGSLKGLEQVFVSLIFLIFSLYQRFGRLVRIGPRFETHTFVLLAACLWMLCTGSSL